MPTLVVWLRYYNAHLGSLTKVLLLGVDHARLDDEVASVPHPTLRQHVVVEGWTQVAEVALCLIDAVLDEVDAPIEVRHIDSRARREHVVHVAVKTTTTANMVVTRIRCTCCCWDVRRQRCSIGVVVDVTNYPGSEDGEWSNSHFSGLRVKTIIQKRVSPGVTVWVCK